ncbi:alpha/beta hydrolase fold domain-containing protein [Amycolatopsis carbonis]|uniref:Alpha/beta hydrolase fold domain-containing protein n=1 Tax=Amycolatopsis carbonis TaxID=715471 RepID=A0A9Y2IQQ7_9PSEU|nr:alpha/beta hydrolase fold domain-containing protein [Amycolatopsis sp. 2-15]WIX83550.1 alpha/beta hydrolase fold domain-containing protein [Amycolatopsis sp. 2-15]
MTDPTFDLRLQAVDPALLEAQREVNAVLAKMPHPDVRTPEGLAALRAGTAHNPGATDLSPTERHVDGPTGPLRLRVFTPPEPRAVLYRIHGGGWAGGAPEDDDLVNDRLARATGTVVVSPEYRLAPEATVGEQIEQTVAVARWLARHAVAEFGTGRLLIGGISAGAHLAAATLLALRDAGDPAFGAFAGAYLDCGIYDLGLSPSAAAATENSLVLTRSWIDGLPDLALPGHTPAQRRDSRLSPALADLTGFPPALLTVGDLDPLRDDAILLAARLRLAGRDARLEIWPEAPHAFTNMATPLGDVALDSAIAWINDLLDPPRTAPGPAAVVHRFVAEVINGGDLDVVDELSHDDLAWHAGSGGDLHGLEAYQAALRAAVGGAFSGMHLTVHDTLVDGDTVVLRFTNSGTHTGPFLGVAATGRHAAWSGIGIYTVRAGKIAEAWFGEDMLGLLRQLSTNEHSLG